MSEKNSIAGKKRWANISPEERSKQMSDVRKKGWSKISKAKRREWALNMVKARKHD